MPRGFLPKIDEKEESKSRQMVTTKLDIEVIEKTIGGKRKEILKLPSIEKVLEKLEEQRGYKRVSGFLNWLFWSKPNHTPV